MATITTRLGKGDPLTFTEMDDNLTNLNTDKLENINSESIGDLSNVDITTSAPTDGQALVWDNANSKFIPGSAGASAIGDLSDVSTSSITDADILMYDSANSRFVASSQYTSQGTASDSGNVTAIDDVRSPNTLTLDSYSNINQGDSITFSGTDVTSAGLNSATTYQIHADIGSGEYEISTDGVTPVSLTDFGTISDLTYSVTSQGDAGFRLNMIADVDNASPSDYSVLSYSATNENWFATNTIEGATLKDYNETVYSLGNINGTEGTDFTINPNNGSIQTATLDGNITINGPTNLSSGESVTLILTQDATGSRTLSSTMLFAGGDGTLSTDPNAVDIIGIFYDGTNYYASLSTGFAQPS